MIFGKKPKAPETSGETIYTCPMHPEVQSSTPGKCPHCGMFLVAKNDAADSGHKHEASDETSGGCCGGHGHQGTENASGDGCCGGQGHQGANNATGDGCCGGHKGEHAHQ